MRILGLLIELLIGCGLVFIVFNSVKALININHKQLAWKEWLKTIENDRNITEDSLLNDINVILKFSEKNIPNESYNALISIKDNIEILKNSPKSLEQIRVTNPEDFLDLLNMLHKYIPESLNKYFSIPEKMKKQYHRNGKNSEDLLNDALLSIEHRFDAITKNLVSEKINELKTYQTFIHNKFD